MKPEPAAQRLLRQSAVHPEWHGPLIDALQAVDDDYLEQLLEDDGWLPGPDRLFAAFRRDRTHCRYLLFGESPYPRAESANGIAFHDAAVDRLWSDSGLSKAVNRATSLRNLIKTALIAEGHLLPDGEGRVTQQAIAALDKRGLIRRLVELFDALEARGVLAFNALPVLRPGHGKAREFRHWQGFLNRLLRGLGDEHITLILWGRIAEDILSLPEAGRFRTLRCEHPYNISFIHNPGMQQLFGEWRLLTAAACNRLRSRR